MNQSEALSLAIEMLERVAPGINYSRREYYERLEDIKAAIRTDETSEANLAPARIEAQKQYPRTAICAGEEFCEIDRQTIVGRELILMESCRDGGEAPGIIVDAISNEIMLDEATDGFQDYLGEMVAL